MPPEQQGDPALNTEVIQRPPDHQDGAVPLLPVGISSFSLVVAGLAFLLSFLTYRRGAHIEKQTRFHRTFDAELREMLRGLEKEIVNLTAFTVPSGRPLDTLREELDPVRTQIEEKCFDVARLLAEIDQSRLSDSTKWMQPFAGQIKAAETLLQATAHANVNTFEKFSEKCREARDRYQRAITGVRKLMDAHEGKV